MGGRGVYIPGQVADIDVAPILIFAIGSLGVYGFIIGGRASDSKYSLLGAKRTCAQLVSYEVALALSVLGVVMMAGTLSLTEIVATQGDALWYGSAVRRPARVPARRQRGDRARALRPPRRPSRAMAGYHTEYGGMRFGLFSMGETST